MLLEHEADLKRAVHIGVMYIKAGFERAVHPEATYIKAGFERAVHIQVMYTVLQCQCNLESCT